MQKKKQVLRFHPSEHAHRLAGSGDKAKRRAWLAAEWISYVFVEELVAEELVDAAAEAVAVDETADREDEEERVPVDHRHGPAGRVGPVLAGPEGDENGDDQELIAEHEIRLAATAAAIERIDLRGGQVALFRGQEGVGHARFSNPSVVLVVQSFGWFESRFYYITTPLPKRSVADYRNATDWIPATSKRLRQRMFLQPTMSSRRTM